MSTDEQIAALGRLASEYAETRKELTLTVSELRKLGQVLSALGNELGRLEVSAFSKPDFGKIRGILAEHSASEYMQVQKLTDAVSRLKDLQSTAADHKSQLESLGVDVR